jgi:hypothetical protein
MMAKQRRELLISARSAQASLSPKIFQQPMLPVLKVCLQALQSCSLIKWFADDVTARFDCVFWMGDLNFRLEKERERVDETVKGLEALEIPSYEDLTQYDELFKLRNEGKLLCAER